MGLYMTLIIVEIIVDDESRGALTFTGNVEGTYPQCWIHEMRNPQLEQTKGTIYF
jgi:hypothetical protein